MTMMNDDFPHATGNMPEIQPLVPRNPTVGSMDQHLKLQSFDHLKVQPDPSAVPAAYWLLARVRSSNCHVACCGDPVGTPWGPRGDSGDPVGTQWGPSGDPVGTLELHMTYVGITTTGNR